MMIKQSILAVACLFSSIFIANSQETGEDQLGTWYIYYGTNTVSDKLSVYTELQCNLYEVASNFEQFWFITSLNYSLTDNAEASFGYGYFNNDTSFEDIPGERHTTENRIFEQLSHSSKVGKFTFQNRYRLEHRFINKPSESVTQHRVRGRFQVAYPLNDDWFLSAFDEVFINLQEPLFSQNRLYGALGYKVCPNVKLQAGFMKIHLTGRSYDRLQFVLNINTDLRKKEVAIDSKQL